MNGALPHGAPVPRLLGSYDDLGWVALGFEDIEGALPVQPWREDELERVLHALTDLAESLTPSPGLNCRDVSPRLGGWGRRVDSPRSLAKLGVVAPDAARELDRHLAWTGPVYADLVMLLGSVALSGLDPERYATRHPLLRGVDPAAVDVLISAQAGFLLAAACSMDSADPGVDPRLEHAMTGLGLASLRGGRRSQG
ncbi:hypothetical protein [Streptomyces sp. NBC_01716]|uniref:hypothetical protein n=1 Tax=Streptomyces sp. NBC_01716 TaxID=2975917 RepID=UPI002E334033|nr:hypothetical protein [Streptomyces sp. NBC_01716]